MKRSILNFNLHCSDCPGSFETCEDCCGGGVLQDADDEGSFTEDGFTTIRESFKTVKKHIPVFSFLNS